MEIKKRLLGIFNNIYYKGNEKQRGFIQKHFIFICLRLMFLFEKGFYIYSST